MNDNAESVLLELLRNGERLSGLYEQSRSATGALDWQSFQTLVKDARLIDAITGIGTAKINAALAAVREERARLRAAWKGKTMPGDVVERLSILSDIGIGLADQKLDAGLTPVHVHWMMEKALPVLRSAVGIVL